MYTMIRTALTAIGGLLLVAVVASIYAVLGAISIGTSAAIIIGVMHFVGLLSAGMAKAALIIALSAGAIFGILVGLAQAAMLG